MRTASMYRAGGIASVAAGVVIPMWWLGQGVVLPVAEATEHWDHMLTHPNWIPLNVLGLVGTLLWPLALVALYLRGAAESRTYGFVGFVLALLGAIGFACIQYYETFLWPVVARDAPALVQIDGPLVFGDPVVAVPLVAAGVALGVGHICSASTWSAPGSTRGCRRCCWRWARWCSATGSRSPCARWACCRSRWRWSGWGSG